MDTASPTSSAASSSPMGSEMGTPSSSMGVQDYRRLFIKEGLKMKVQQKIGSKKEVRYLQISRAGHYGDFQFVLVGMLIRRSVRMEHQNKHISRIARLVLIGQLRKYAINGCECVVSN